MVALILFEHVGSLNWILSPVPGLCDISEGKGHLYMSMEDPHSGFTSRAPLSNQKFSAVVLSSPFLFPVWEGGIDIMIPQTSRFCSCSLFFSWHNRYCSFHGSVFSFTVSCLCSLHFLIKFSCWAFWFICVLFSYFCVTALWICLCWPLSSLSIVLGRFAAVCSRTFITAALTLLSTVFLSHLSVSVASAHWSEIFASWYGKFFFF